MKNKFSFACFVLFLFVPIYSMEWVAAITKGLIIGVPTWQLYQSNKSATISKRRISEDLKRELPVWFETNFLKWEYLYGAGPEIQKLKEGIATAQQKYSNITQLPTIVWLRENDYLGDLKVATVPLKDHNENKCSGLSGSKDFFMKVAEGEKYVEAILYHEAGHLSLKHHEKSLELNLKIDIISFFASIAIYFGLAYLPKVNPTESCERHVNIIASQWLTQNIIKNYYSRQKEREADDYAVKNCKNPDALESLGFRQFEEHKADLDAYRYFAPLYYPLKYITNIAESHPPLIDRSILFIKAADTLRKQQADQKI